MSRIRCPLSIVLPVLVILVTTGGVALGLGYPPIPAGENDIEPTFERNDDFRSSSVMFIENVGQWKEDARFQVWGGLDNAMWLAEDAIWLTVMEPEVRNWKPEDLMDFVQDDTPRNGVNIKIGFPNANPHPTIETFNRLDTAVSYLLGNNPEEWRPDVPVWAGMRYVDLWPGVNLEIGNQNGRVVQRFVAEEGADKSAVRMLVEGADTAEIDGNWLHLVTEVQDLTLSLPLSDFYEIETLTKHGPASLLVVQSVDVDSIRDTQASTTPGDNPADLLYGTFLGGNSYDRGYDITVDGSGSAYLTGSTRSSDFPTTIGAFETNHNGGYDDAFVAKLNPAGSGLNYATFLGGSSSDYGRGIAVDGNGSAYVTGNTSSSNFPSTPDAFDPNYHPDPDPDNLLSDAFVVKLNPAGSGLDYATFLGGIVVDEGAAITVDGNGSAYVGGYTQGVDFPTTPGAFNTNDGTAFVAKLNPAGSGLDYSTFLDISVCGIVVDGNGSAYVTGGALVVKLNPSGSGLDYSTFLGGSSKNESCGIAVDKNGSAFVTGYTLSSDFPTTPGAFDTSRNGHYDAFVVKLNPAGNSLLYATFLGGVDGDWGYDIAVDGTGSAYVTGETQSIDFPTTPDAFDTSYTGSYDAYVVKLNPAGDGLLYATFLGGVDGDRGVGNTVDEAGNVYVVGNTNSSDFPAAPGSFDTSYNLNYDAFVAKLAIGGAEPTPTPTSTFTPTPTITPTATDTPTLTPTLSPFGSISGYVFEDYNKNHVRDPGEPPVMRSEVKLYSTSDNLLYTLKTDVNGYYQFVSLEPGDYRLIASPPQGWAMLLSERWASAIAGYDTPDVDFPAEATSPAGWIWDYQAEGGTVVSPMIKGSDAAACDNQFITSPVTSYEPNPPVAGYANYSFEVPSDGEYYLWLRGMGLDWKENSVWVTVDGSESYFFEITDLYGEWTWRWEQQPEEPYALSAGEHAMQISGREANTRIDRVLITDNASYVPGGSCDPISTATPTPTATTTATVTPTPTPTITPTITPTSICADDYEPDNIWQEAHLILLDNELQQHNFHQSGDVDYVKFGVTAGVQLALYTDNLGSGVDTTLTLYDTDGVTHLAYNDIDPANPPASRIEWATTASGTYFLKVAHFNPEAGGCNMTYGLAVDRITPTSTSTHTPVPSTNFYLPLLIYLSPPPTPTPTATPTATLTPTQTATPTATLTPTPHPIHILPNHSIQRINCPPSCIEKYQIVGEIQNDTEKVVRDYYFPILLIDESGTISENNKTYVYISALFAGDKTCFRSFSSFLPDTWDDYEFGEPSYRESDRSNWGNPYHLRNLSMQHVDTYEGKRYVVSGEAIRRIHPCPPHCYSASIIVTFYDRNNQVIGCVHGGCSPSSDSNSCSFEIKLWREKTDGITYRVRQSPVYIP